MFLLIIGGCSKPASPPAAVPSWLGEHEYRSTDGNGSLSVVKNGARVEATIEVSQADGCRGSIGGALDIQDRRARLAPPLFVVDGSERHEETGTCELELALRGNGTIEVREQNCLAYHGLNCGFASDYPRVTPRAPGNSGSNPR
jgi:hypothetical protein